MVKRIVGSKGSGTGVRKTKASTPQAEAGKPLDPRAKRLLEAIERQAEVKRRPWAIRAGMKPTQLSAIFNDRNGTSIERYFDLADAAGVVLAIARPSADNPVCRGTAGKGGWIMLDGLGDVLPAIVEVSEDFGPFKAGDVLVIERGGFEADSWVLVRHPDDKLRAHLCVDDAGQRVLETDAGEESRYNPKLQTIVGIVAEWRRRPRGRMK